MTWFFILFLIIALICLWLFALFIHHVLVLVLKRSSSLYAFCVFARVLCACACMTIARLRYHYVEQMYVLALRMWVASCVVFDIQTAMMHVVQRVVFLRVRALPMTCTCLDVFARPYQVHRYLCTHVVAVATQALQPFQTTCFKLVPMSILFPWVILPLASTVERFLNWNQQLGSIFILETQGQP